MGFFKKIGSSFVSFYKFIREGIKELKKVRWPNRKELTSYSIIVIFTVAFVTLFFFVVDFGILTLLNLIGLA